MFSRQPSRKAGPPIAAIAVAYRPAIVGNLLFVSRVSGRIDGALVEAQLAAYQDVVPASAEVASVATTLDHLTDALAPLRGAFGFAHLPEDFLAVLDDPADDDY